MAPKRREGSLDPNDQEPAAEIWCTTFQRGATLFAPNFHASPGAIWICDEYTLPFGLTLVYSPTSTMSIMLPARSPLVRSAKIFPSSVNQKCIRNLEAKSKRDKEMHKDVVACNSQLRAEKEDLTATDSQMILVSCRKRSLARQSRQAESKLPHPPFPLLLLPSWYFTNVGKDDTVTS